MTKHHSLFLLYNGVMSLALKQGLELIRDGLRPLGENVNIPTTDRQLLDLTYRYTGIRVPEHRICPDHVAPATAFCDAYFARSPVTVWKAARGLGGKSVLLAALSMMEAITLGASVNLLGGSGEQSRRIHDYMRGEEPGLPDRFWKWKDAPRYLLRQESTIKETKLINHGRINVLMASQTSVRGSHPQKLRVDECDEVAMDVLQAARGQPQSSRGISSQMVFSSTHHNPDGTMTAILKEAAEKGWPVNSWCFRETAAAWLSQEEIERKRQMVTNQMWEVEFDLQEPTSEGRAIMVEKLNSTFRRELGEYKPGPGELIIAEPYHEGGSYVTGADWAKRKDWTVIVTMRYDCEPARVVAFEYTGRLPWPAMIAKFDKRMEMYPGNGIHDRTGIGDVVDDYLEDDAYGVVMVGNKRKSLFTHYIGAIEGGKIEGPHIEHLFNEHKYASYEDVYGNGHPPDSFVACALCWDIAQMGW